MNRHPIWKHIEEKADCLRKLSNELQAVPETCYGVHKSAALHLAELSAQGFLQRLKMLLLMICLTSCGGSWLMVKLVLT